MPNEEVIVLDIAGNRAMIACERPSVEGALRGLGFLPEGTYLVRGISDDADGKAVVQALVPMGALFSSGKDWSPAELVELYRDQGVITTPYKIISWKSPDQYGVIVR